MKYKRASGILLHPTSLPGPDGIGDLGPEAYKWIDFLADSGCSIWQVLPLGPTGYGDSPYQCFSAFAGNPYLISPTNLLNDDLLTRQDMINRPDFPITTIDYGKAIQWKIRLLNRAFQRFQDHKAQDLTLEFSAFQSEQAAWLDDYALFMSIKESQGGISWGNWSSEYRKRDPKALNQFAIKHQQDILKVKFQQFIFYRQWQAVRKYANDKGIRIIGDIPIFVAYDSADAWSNPDLFYIDDEGQPTVVAGVPPDYFSLTGQLWGNPLYRWAKHAETGYSWWIDRFRSILQSVDIVRLDHFRGFAGYWEVPAGNPTAENGLWVQGPGSDLFVAVREALGNLPILAEDLGEITPDVIRLRDQFDLPGMRIFQFAFSADSTDPFLPHNYIQNCVAYTGTHDNDTALGWYKSAPVSETDFCRRYLARSGDDISWDMIRAVWSSVAVFSLAPMQDLLSLGNDARMNFPGKPSGNWGWRMSPHAITDDLVARLYETNFLYRRLPNQQEEKKKKPIIYIVR